MIGTISKEDAKHLTNFKERRTKAGLTLREVEKETGISNCYLSQLETGKFDNPGFHKVVLLHNLYSKYENK